MRCFKKLSKLLVTGFGYLVSLQAVAFDSGSTGEDGVFNPFADVEVSLSVDGVSNFESVNIPSDVTVTFERNLINSPVIWLVQGDVVIDGVIDLSGVGKTAGPGGFDGGTEGLPGIQPGGGGQGPGGGGAGASTPGLKCSGGGGSYGSSGTLAQGCSGVAGAVYGRDELLPLLGGSGGGGGTGSSSSVGSSGTGGGGAILIAASGTISINGSIVANSDNVPALSGANACGGAGSGGAIRLVATTVDGNGTLTAIAGSNACFFGGLPANGGAGRIRIETENLLRTSGTNPAFTTDLPQPLFIPSFPQLSISTIAGVAVPANPTGMDDVSLPAGTANPVTVVFTAQDIPLGSEIDLRVTPLRGAETTFTSAPSTGTVETSTASVAAVLPIGSSTLIASVEFVVDSTASIRFSPYADGQLVARIRSSFEAGVGSVTTFITQDGKEYTWPTTALN